MRATTTRSEIPEAAANGLTIRKLSVGWIIERRRTDMGLCFEPIAGFKTLVEALEFLDEELARYEPPAKA